MKLSEHIQMIFTKKTGLGRLSIISEKKNTKGDVLPFTGKVPDYIIPKAFLFAALSSFRANIYYNATDNKIGWIQDPIILCDNCYVELFKKIYNAYKVSYHNEVKKVGSDPMMWQVLYNAVDNNVKPIRATGAISKEYDI